MSFSSFPFLLGFLPVATGGYALFRRFGDTCGKSWLIALSLLFYAAGAARFLPLLILSVSGNYLLLLVLRRHPRTILTTGIAANLTLLALFKFSTPFPLGLSFFTFTQIGCLLHHADATTKPPKPADYALFAAFFPALLAGPILNPRETLDQFTRIGPLTAANLATGSGFFLIGLLKKTLLADPLAPIVAAGFHDPTSLTLLPAWQTAAAWSLQLYFDFSGYTDMAIGLAAMFGLRFPDNFAQPYRATSIIAYWQCWHMSLTRFLMANIHTPLTMTILRHRRATGRRIDLAAQRSLTGFLTMIATPIAATMLLVALWHGATLPFLVFGLLHIAYLLINHAWRLQSRAPAIPPPLAAILTYLAVLIAAVFFRAQTLDAATTLLAAMAGHQGTAIPPDAHIVRDTLWLVALYAIVWFVPTTRQWMQGPTRFAWQPTAAWAVVMGGAATLGLLAAGGTGEFVYFRF